MVTQQRGRQHQGRPPALQRGLLAGVLDEVHPTLRQLYRVRFRLRQLRSELAAEGHDILKRAALSSPELAAALDTWREIRFDFATVDTLDPATV